MQSLEHTIRPDSNIGKPWKLWGYLELDRLWMVFYLVFSWSLPRLQGAGACILAFSTTDRDSFDAVESWYKKAPFNHCILLRL